ncbi:MAG: ester cyclase [Aestuariivirga sp.]
MSTETNKQKSRKFQEYHDNGDLDAMIAAMAPDVAAYANGGDAMTREKFDGMMRMISAAFSNGRHIFEGQVAEGDWVATRMTWTALHTGDFNGVPASNRPARIAGSVHDRFKDGKIIEHHAVFDSMALMMQIGAIPAPA